MIIRTVKVLILAIAFAMAGIASANPLATNKTTGGHDSNGVATRGVSALHIQITQTSARLLKQPASKITLKDLKLIVILAQKYFSTRKEIEEPLFRQRLEEQRNFGYQNDASLQESNLPSVQLTLIAVFQHYLSANHATNSVSALTQLRNILRQLQSMNQGHLSGGTWIYNSPLPTFAVQHLQPLDKRIIDTSLASAATRRKKHQYASAIKTYKTLLANYANTSHAAPLKVLLDGAIVEDYNYQAKWALAKHDYKKGRAALRKIIALYPESDFANAAQKALDGIVPVAVQFYKKQGQKYFHPEKQFRVPQTQAGVYFEKMYKEDPKGPEAGYALYYWARSLGTQGKVSQAVKMLKDFDKRFPRSEMQEKALFLEGFYNGENQVRNFKRGANLMAQFARQHPKAKEAPDALWYGAFYSAYAGNRQQAVDMLMSLKKHYPKNNHAKHAGEWIAQFHKGWPKEDG